MQTPTEKDYDWNLQHTDEGWIATNSDTYAEIGPFPTIAEATAYITRYDNCQEWQDKVAAELQALGHAAEAEEFRNASTEYAMTYRDTTENPLEAAHLLLNEIT